MTATIRALIVDDEPFARAGVRLLLARARDVEVVGECSNGLEAVAAIAETAPDLVFLDVQMPELDGFGVVEAVGAARMPAVIFVTAFDEHAIRAFDVHALDYLLKPLDDERFALALERARARLRGDGGRDLRAALAALVGQARLDAPPLERLAVKSGGRVYFVAVDDVDWVEAADNYVSLHAGRETHLVHGTLGALERRLDPRRFLRVHRSTIVNLARVRELRPLFHGEYEIVLADGTRLTSGRSYRDALRRLVENPL
jgi:two-component system, LytTR family, response regulator